jgi:hypothetical protein
MCAVVLIGLLTSINISLFILHFFLLVSINTVFTDSTFHLLTETFLKYNASPPPPVIGQYSFCSADLLPREKNQKGGCNTVLGGFLKVSSLQNAAY